MRQLAIKLFTTWATQVYGPYADIQHLPITALLQPDLVQSLL
jgi:hypothetical protein